MAYLMIGCDLPVSALVQTGRMLWIVFPHLIVVFALAGMIQVIIPTEYVSKMIGGGFGIKGILIAIATVTGAFTPGDYVNFPIVVALYKSGVNIGPLAAYLDAW